MTQEIKLPPLPKWSDSAKAVKAGESTTLQHFIYMNEPNGDSDAAFWRDQLGKALKEAIDHARRIEGENNG